MPKAVFCTTKTQSQATQIIDQLRAVGFRNDDISVLFPDTRGSKDSAHEQHTKAPEGAVAGTTTGGVIGGTLGLLAGIGALAIPGLGPFIAAGPIMAALSGAAVGAGVFGITGALVGMGISEIEAKRYEGKVRSGNILISVHADVDTWADRAKDVFKRLYGEDIATASEARTPRDSGVPIPGNTNANNRRP